MNDKINPDEIFGDNEDDRKVLADQVDRFRRVQQLFAKNGYDGKYRPQFEDVYEDILEAKDTIERQFEDGFQFGDLEEIIVAVSPVLKAIYDEFYATLKDEKEAEAFLKDLVIFIYYEVEDKISSWGWLKGILRLVLRLFVAGKIAKYMKIAFDYTDGKISVLTDKVQGKVDQYLEFLD